MYTVDISNNADIIDSRDIIERIDWKLAARDLPRDYLALEFDGVTYWAR